MDDTYDSESLRVALARAVTGLTVMTSRATREGAMMEYNYRNEFLKIAAALERIAEALERGIFADRPADLGEPPPRDPTEARTAPWR
jgi:hypothetical protein